MALYNYPTVNNNDASIHKSAAHKSKDFFNEDSLCITEENRF